MKDSAPKVKLSVRSKHGNEQGIITLEKR